MSSVRGLFTRWRNHRRARRQQALERDCFERRRPGSGESAPSAYRHTNGVWFWIGVAGDGGGDGGGGGAG